MLYNWEGEGWCLGVIKKATEDTSKTIDAAVINFEIYYQIDDDIAGHVLGLEACRPDGPVDSWVLLHVTAALPNLIT